MTEKQNYIDKATMLDHFRVAKQSDDKEPFIKDCYLICDRILKSHRFRDYPWELKQDFRQEAILKCMRAFTNFDENKSSNLFGFITCTIQRSILDQLRKHYRQLNNRKKFLKDMLGSCDEEACREMLKKLEDCEWKDIQHEN